MTKHRKVYIGCTFNRLTVVREGSDRPSKIGVVRTQICSCSCGATVTVPLQALKSGNTKSCGCLKIELFLARTVTHGLTRDKLSRKVYSAWNDMKRRCYDVDHSEYKRYGAVGVVVQDSWLSDPVAFHSYVVQLPDFCKERSLDRIDNDLGYFEGNIRWATDNDQTRNQGKQVNNTSGANGVTWNQNDSDTRAIAWWNEGVKTKSKTFSVRKYGLLPAFRNAVNHREKMIIELNKQGYGYSDKHGK